MQGLVDVGRMGCQGPIQPTSTNQKTLFAIVNLSLMHFTSNIQIPMNPFHAKNLKTNYNATMALRGLMVTGW
jgi:hypothetical protein